jgi:hypothetical protein
MSHRAAWIFCLLLLDAGCSKQPAFRPNRVPYRTDETFTSCCSHPASRRRSCSWLQAGERMPEEDFHLSDQARFQAHVRRRSPSQFQIGDLRLAVESKFASSFLQIDKGRGSSGNLRELAIPLFDPPVFHQGGGY